MKGVRVILLWLQLVWITQINACNGGSTGAGMKIDCARVKRRCKNDIFVARCIGDQTIKSPCCGPKGDLYELNKRDCPNEMKALEASCNKNTFEALQTKVQVKGKSLPCECAPYVCDAEIGKKLDKQKKGKGPNHLVITEGPCCDTKSEFYDKCPNWMKTFEKRSPYSCRMVFVNARWFPCKNINCAKRLDFLRKYPTKGVPKQQSELIKKSYDAWKSLCCSKSMLHEQCPKEMASFDNAAGSCD